MFYYYDCIQMLSNCVLFQITAGINVELAYFHRFPYIIEDKLNYSSYI